MDCMHFLEKLKKQPLLAAIIAVIIVFAAANAFLLLSQNKKPMHFYSTYVEEKHVELTGVFSDLKEGALSEELLDQNSTEAEFLYYLYDSMLEDTYWFEEKEKQIYEKTINAGTVEGAREGFAEHVSLELVFQNALILNAYPAETEFWQFFEEHYGEEIKEAQKIAGSLEAESFLKGFLTAELLKDSTIDKELIREPSGEIMGKYIEFRKNAFESALASGNKMKSFVEANKIVGLHELTIGAE